MKRQLISSALALSMIFGGAAALPESITPQSGIVAQAKSIRSGDFKYSLLKDGTAKIVGYNGKKSEVKIPSKIDGKKVTMIGKNAFYPKYSPDSDNIKSITIPKGVTRIGFSAFSDCTNLKTVKIPSGVKKIEADTFSGCSATLCISCPSPLSVPFPSHSKSTASISAQTSTRRPSVARRWSLYSSIVSAMANSTGISRSIGITYFLQNENIVQRYDIFLTCTTSPKRSPHRSLCPDSPTLLQENRHHGAEPQAVPAKHRAVQAKLCSILLAHVRKKQYFCTVLPKGVWR